MHDQSCMPWGYFLGPLVLAVGTAGVRSERS